MKVSKRPYAGNWSEEFLNKYKTTRSWTPDAIVKFNGETTLPGCPTCNNRIDFSRFISSVSASGGLDGSNGCDITLKIPWAYGDSVYKDGKFILTTGIEVFVYYRGFFQVKDLALTVDNIELSNGEILSAPDVETRPYYPVFHGVIESVNVTPTDGSYEVSIGTRNMLSFWDNQQINTQQGYFASDPTMSRGSINLRGHVYTNMTPHQIIYDLFLDAGGSAEGTGFALRRSSNITAKTSTNQQLYSLHLRYLQERFKNGMYGLRMFGASGRMYTGLETQIIANEVTQTKQDAEFRSVIKEQKKPYASPKSKHKAFSRLVKAGMIAYELDNAVGGRAQRRIDGQQLAQASEKDTVGVSVLSQKPFVTDIGQFAQVAFFESNLETKKAIAERVCQVTGYEFYQDMDGDLVFKPPMYNMDTTRDRVYNIYREDTISISFSHSEPTATYVTCKGSHFRNHVGAAPDGEWGVKGVYVDYALVAKYGWRGHDFDSTFYNNPRQAYYAAAVELDKQNKATEGCDITIPLRPEIKPGYPIWVEENDCFYYVESVSHSFSFGSSCTTQLTLTCQRKKFIPPGNRDVKYSQDPARAVDLGRTELAEKYVYRRYDRQGEGDINAETTQENIAYSKITGFPNVVMALDPNNANPSMLMYDPDFQNLGTAGSVERRQYLRMIVNEAKRLGLLKTNPNDPNATMENGPWVLYRPNAETKRPEWIPLGVEKGNKDGEVLVPRRGRKGNVLTTWGGWLITRKTKLDSDLVNYNIAGINALDVITAQVRADGEKAEKATGKARTAAKAAEIDQQNREQVLRDMRIAVNGTEIEGGNPVATIIDLISVVQAGLGRGESTSPLQNLISALADRKASFAPKAKGYFRYYSSSHPSTEHQGPDIYQYNHDPQRDRPTLVINENTPDATSNNTVKSAGDGDHVYFDTTPNRTVRGILTRTMYSNRIEYVPTKDIVALSFQVSENYTVNKVDGPKTTLSRVWFQSGLPPGTEFWKQAETTLKNRIAKIMGRKYLDYKISKLFSTRGIFSNFTEVKEIKIPEGVNRFEPSEWDKTNVVGVYENDGTIITSNTTTTISDLNLNMKGVSKYALLLAQCILYYLRLDIKSRAEFSDLYSEIEIEGEGAEESDLEKHLIAVNRVFRAPLLQNQNIEVERFAVKVKKKEPMITPIFPISDDRGYEVFGAYQYGRGLKVARGTLFDALLKQDPSQILNKKQMDALLVALDKANTREDYREARKEIYLEALRNLDPQARERIAIGLGLDASVSLDEHGNRVTDDNALVNGLVTLKDEQVISNIPLQLTQINPPEDGNEACTCRILSTDALLLEGSLNLDNFVEIENPLLRAVRNKAEENAPEWREHTSALRGENITPATQGGFATSTGFGSGFDFNNRASNRLVQAVAQGDNVITETAFGEAVSNVTTNLNNVTTNLNQVKAKAERLKGDE
jgi:hypothetical protein